MSRIPFSSRNVRYFLLYDSLAADRRESEYPRVEGASQALPLLVTALGLPLADRFLVVDGDPVLAYWVTGGLIGVFALLRAAVVNFFHPALADAGVPVHFYGTVLAVVNVVGALAAWRAHGWVRRFGERAAMVAMPLTLLYMVCLLTQLKLPPAALLFCIQGVAFGAYPVVVRSILNRLVRRAERRATVLSIESFACRVAFSPLTVLAGWSLGALGLDAALALTALLACIPFVILPLLRRAT